MKNNFLKIFVLFVAFFALVLNAQAVINSKADVSQKINQLSSIASYDFSSLVNKTELIGLRRESFNMATSQYKNQIITIIQNLNRINTQIDLVMKSDDFSDSQKQLQVSKLYQDADSTLFDLNSKTLEYLFSLRGIMPTITYGRYIQKFQDYYNQFNLTSGKISVK